MSPPARCRSPLSRTTSSNASTKKSRKVYDLTFGPTLHPGRLIALERMGIKPGDKILEVGVGTGINAPLYPRNCHVTGIDFSAKMLEKARERVAKKGVTNVQLHEMDAANLTFADGSFDIVYAPYVISVVSDPSACRQRDAARLPARWKDRHPEPLPKPVPWSRESSGRSRRSPSTSASRPISTFPDSSRSPTSNRSRSRKSASRRIWSLVTCIKN